MPVAELDLSWRDQLGLDNEYFAEVAKYCQHFETETYTYFVLPDPKEAVTESIAKELDWARKHLS